MIKKPIDIQTIKQLNNTIKKMKENQRKHRKAYLHLDVLINIAKHKIAELKK